jgi:hypothetical protein
MGLITTSFTSGTTTQGNPCEILWNNIGTDNYIRLDLLSGSTTLFQGVYYEDINNSVYIDLQPIINNLINYDQFDIDSTTKYTELNHSIANLKYKIYDSSGGTYYYKSSGSTLVIPQSFTNEDWLVNYIYKDYSNVIDPFQGNNLLLNSLGNSSYNTNPIQRNFSFWNTNSGSTNFNYTFGTYYTTYTKSSNTLGSYYTTYTPNTTYKTDQQFYLHFRYNYFSGNTLNDAVKVSFLEYDDDEEDFYINTSITLRPSTNSWKEITLPVTLIEQFQPFQIKIQMTGNTGTFFYLSNVYFGINSFNNYEPCKQQVIYFGQNTNRNGNINNNYYKQNDFILNDLHQYYAAQYVDINNQTYLNYISHKTPKETLRYSPRNLQVYVHNSAKEYMNVNVIYLNGETLTYQGRVNLNTGYYSTNTYSIGNLNFSYDAVNLSYIDNISHIFLDIQNTLLNVTNDAWPAYGRRLIYKIKDTCDYKGNVYQLYYINRRGGVDWFIMGGNCVKTITNKSNSYKKNWRKSNVSSIAGKSSTIINPTYLVDSETSWLLNSEILYDYEYNQFDDLFSSPKLWLYDAQTDLTHSVSLDDKSFTYKQHRFDKLNNIQLTVIKQLSDYRF